MSPRRHFPVILAALAGLALGRLLGLGEARESHAGTEAGMSVQADGSRARGSGSPAIGTKPRRNFAAYLGRVGIPMEQAEATASAGRMSAGELRGILLAAPAGISGKRRSAEEHLHFLAVMAAGRELFRREGPAAVDWSDGSGSKEARVALLAALCAADPAAASGRIESFRQAYGSDWSAIGIFTTAAMEAAALRGPDEVMAVQKIWDTPNPAYIDFAPGFDFGGYLGKAMIASDTQRRTSPMAEAWAAANPDAVLKDLPVLVRGNPEAASMFRDAFAGHATMTNEAEAARWGCKLLLALPEAARGTAIESIADSYDLSASRAAEFVKALPSDEGRLHFAGHALWRSGFGNSAESAAALGAMDSEDLRVKTLVGVLKREDLPGSSPRREQLANLEKLMTAAGISAEGMAEVRAAIPPEREIREAH